MLGVDSAFLKKDGKLSSMNVTTCGEMIRIFINAISSAGEAWPFCANCGTYVDVIPSD
jgi:hypothetical protein